jgi:hypothetical protein
MSYCIKCGTQEGVGQKFCPVCGAASAIASAPRGFSGREARVLLGINLDPSRQSRWSVLFRFLLLLPLIFVLVAIWIAALCVSVAAWFNALFTGRVPDGMQQFLTKALRFNANFMAYEFLLIPRWPGITLNEKANDQVRIEVDHTELRRTAVFFRAILAIPALIVQEAVSLGMYPLVLVMWVWGIITGREPRALHQALALLLRFTIRVQAYLLLLTPTQPFEGFFGDENLLGNTYAAPDARTLPTTWMVIKPAKVLVVIALILSVPLYVLQRSEHPVSWCHSSISTGCMSLPSRAPGHVVAVARPIGVTTASATHQDGQPRRLLWPMCRNITILRGLEPVASAEEIEAAARQYVRKVSGVQSRSKSTDDPFEVAVQRIAATTAQLLRELPPRRQPPTSTPPLRRVGTK